MVIDWNRVSCEADNNERIARNLRRLDVFHHIASLGAKYGHVGKVAGDVEAVYDAMVRSPSMKGDKVKHYFGVFGKYCETQLTSVWRLLKEIDP